MTNDEWITPDRLFDLLNTEFGFTCDVAATAENAKCRTFFDKERDGLAQEWGDERCFMNPPYSRGNLPRWAAKAYHESANGALVVGVLPVDTSTEWWHTFVMRATEIRFLKGRVQFVDPDLGRPNGPARFGTAIVVWRPGFPYSFRFDTQVGQIMSSESNRMPSIRSWDWTATRPVSVVSEGDSSGAGV